MNNTITKVAATAADSPDLFGSLGIDWRLLVLQTIAFLILLLILKKLVYPPLMAMLDKRDQAAKASADAVAEAQKYASEAEARTAAMVEKAKREAADIVTTAKQEASAMSEKSEEKARAKAEAIAAASLEELNKEVVTARKMLRNEALDLVALATEKVVGKTVSGSVDEKLIEKSLEEVS